MGNIVILDELTINQIAAGEVIERPANVVKELVENSLDAGAREIIVEIKKGGKTYIKVTDNGCGMQKEDLVTSIERHATSKIKNIDDLENTYTMGFRGEALASIASISDMSITTKNNDSEIGIKMVSRAGEILSFEEVGCKTGTSIVVENIFFNTPVRYKFLKQDAAEFKHIKEWIQKAALANPDVSFKLINENQKIFSSNGNGKIQDVIYALYGKEIRENLIEVKYSEDGINVTGAIGNTMIAKDTRKDQIIFLNKRNIKNKVLQESVDQAFKGSIGIGKYGFCIINLNMPASFYDVNVHPTKMEVRFEDESKIYKVVYNAIKTSLLSSEFLGNNSADIKNEYIEDEFKFITKGILDNKENEESKIKEDYNERKAEVKNKNDVLRNRENERKIEYKYLGIIFKTFIIVEIKDELYLIDQHAAHERVLYEQIKENYKNHIENNSQMMLVPEIVNLNSREMSFIIHNIRLFKDIGFDIEVFGKDSVKISGIPDLEYRSKTKNIFLDILDEMITSTRTSIKDIEERFIATVACKAAVKANMDLGKEEVDNLIQSLLKLNNPYTCPHGRPTTIKFSKDFFDNKIWEK